MRRFKICCWGLPTLVRFRPSIRGLLRSHGSRDSRTRAFPRISMPHYGMDRGILGKANPSRQLRIGGADCARLGIYISHHRQLRWPPDLGWHSPGLRFEGPGVPRIHG